VTRIHSTVLIAICAVLSVPSSLVIQAAGIPQVFHIAKAECQGSVDPIGDRPIISKTDHPEAASFDWSPDLCHVFVGSPSEVRAQTELEVSVAFSPPDRVGRGNILVNWWSSGRGSHDLWAAVRMSVTGMFGFYPTVNGNPVVRPTVAQPNQLVDTGDVDLDALTYLVVKEDHVKGVGSIEVSFPPDIWLRNNADGLQFDGYVAPLRTKATSVALTYTVSEPVRPSDSCCFAGRSQGQRMRLVYKIISPTTCSSDDIKPTLAISDVEFDVALGSIVCGVHLSEWESRHTTLYPKLLTLETLLRDAPVRPLLARAAAGQLNMLWSGLRRETGFLRSMGQERASFSRYLSEYIIPTIRQTEASARDDRRRRQSITDLLKYAQAGEKHSGIASTIYDELQQILEEERAVSVDDLTECLEYLSLLATDLERQSQLALQEAALYAVHDRR
jgi:hypothetical protein